MAQEKEILSEECINGFMEMMETQAVEIDNLEEENEDLKMQIRGADEEIKRQFFRIQEIELKLEKAKSGMEERDRQIIRMKYENADLNNRLVFGGRMQGIIIVESMIMMAVILCYARWWLPLLQVVFLLGCLIIERFFYQNRFSSGCP